MKSAKDEQPKPNRANLKTRRIGFGPMEGSVKIPDGLDTMCSNEIEELFYGNPDKFKDLTKPRVKAKPHASKPRLK